MHNHDMVVEVYQNISTGFHLNSAHNWLLITKTAATDAHDCIISLQWKIDTTLLHHIRAMHQCSALYLFFLSSSLSLSLFQLKFGFSSVCWTNHCNSEPDPYRILHNTWKAFVSGAFSLNQTIKWSENFQIISFSWLICITWMLLWDKRS